MSSHANPPGNDSETSDASDTRLYGLGFRDTDGLAPWLDFHNSLLVMVFSSRDGLHQLPVTDILVLCRRADLPLTALLGRVASLQISLANGNRTAITGLVSQASQLGSDGGLTRYQIRLSSWLSLLSHTSQSRVWQEQALETIIDEVFTDYSPHAHWQWSDDARLVLNQLPVRSYCVQYRETPLAFISRLLAEDGFSFRVDFDCPDAPSGHRLVLFADSTDSHACPDTPGQTSLGLRYTGSGSQQQTDSLIRLSNHCRLQPNRVTLSSFDYKAKALRTANIDSDLHFGGEHYAQLPSIEHYDSPGAYAFTDNHHAGRHARLRIQAHEARGDYWQGLGTVRSLRAGQRFGIDGNPRNQQGQIQAYVSSHVVQVGINNLPTAVLEQQALPMASIREWLVDTLADQCHDGQAPSHHGSLQPGTFGFGSTDAFDPFDPFGDTGTDPLTAAPHDINTLLKTVQALGYANAFTAIPANRPWRPWQGLRLNAKPTALGSQTARVVCFDNPMANSTLSGITHQQMGNGEICCDRLGRVRIRFHWQDPLDATGHFASCWVRVAQRSAVGGMGMQFLPRIGQEVQVQFLEGDIDRPIIIGAHYNGQGQGGVPATPDGKPATSDSAAFNHATDHHPSAQLNLTAGHAPVWHGASPSKPGHHNAAAQWGIRSQEYSGPGYNQLVFDDTDQQGRIQLKTTQTGAQLNLGHLIHTADNHRGSYRGQGLELRTDAWGALRAGAGWLLSSYTISHTAHQRHAAGDCPAVWGLLHTADTLSQALSQLAQTHLSVAMAAQLGSSQANSSHLSDKLAPLKALRQASQGQVDGRRLDAASTDADNQNTQVHPHTLPQLTDPLITLASQDDLSLSARQSLQFNSSETLNFLNAADSQSTTGGQWRIHSGQAIGVTTGGLSKNNIAGLQLIAAQGDTHLQAHSDKIAIKARDQLDIKSAHSHIDLAAAQHITLRTAGGAGIEIKGGHITLQCPGKLTVHAGQKVFLGPTRIGVKPPAFGQTTFHRKPILHWHDSTDPIRNRRYRITTEDGRILEGRTDNEGHTQLVDSDHFQMVGVELLPDDE